MIILNNGVYKNSTLDFTKDEGLILRDIQFFNCTVSFGLLDMSSIKQINFVDCTIQCYDKSHLSFCSFDNCKFVIVNQGYCYDKTIEGLKKLGSAFSKKFNKQTQEI